jgi:hypothetical protein
MPTFKIACTWQVYGQLEIEANTLEEAIEIAEDDATSLPQISDYVDGSFEVDHLVSEEINKHQLHVLEIWEKIRKEEKND